LIFFCKTENNLDVSGPKTIKLTTMKNFKRILLLITLVVIANKVLFSDSDLFKAETKTTTVVVNR